VVERHAYKGLEATLLDELNKWLSLYTFYIEVNINIYNATEKELVIFDANGFEKVSREIIRPTTHPSYEEFHLRKMLTIQSGREIMKLQGETIYLKTVETEKPYLIMYELYLKNTKIGELSAKKLNKKEARIHFDLESAFYNYGLGETLLKQISGGIPYRPSVKQIEVLIFPNETAKRILFQNHGFIRTENYLADNARPMRFVKHL
jgi:hypothetical protein